MTFSTELRAAFTAGIKDVLEKHPETIDPKKLGAAGRERVIQLVMETMEVCG